MAELFVVTMTFFVSAVAIAVGQTIVEIMLLQTKPAIDICESDREIHHGQKDQQHHQHRDPHRPREEEKQQEGWHHGYQESQQITNCGPASEQVSSHPILKRFRQNATQVVPDTLRNRRCLHGLDAMPTSPSIPWVKVLTYLTEVPIMCQLASLYTNPHAQVTTSRSRSDITVARDGIRLAANDSPTGAMPYVDDFRHCEQH